MSARPKILFVVTEDWFFVSHFLSVAAAARAAGFDVTVLTRLRDAALAARIRAAGVEILPSEHRRGHFGPADLVRHVAEFRAAIAGQRPDIVHCVSLRMILLGGLAAQLAGVRRRVYAVTGLGLLGASRGAKAATVRRALGLALRGPLGGRGVRYVFENGDDAGLLGLPATPDRAIIVGGAGVDPAGVEPTSPPPQPPLKLALVARMVKSKGVDVAVEAVRLARAAGAEVELSLYGAPDSHNPRSFDEATLRAWSEQPGVAWHGHTGDVPAVWRGHHVACVPSLGGEGLPRSLLEAAAQGRAILTTATPGCRDFVRDGREGRLVPPGDAHALADAMIALAADPQSVARMGAAARARLSEGFTTAQVAEKFVALYRALMAP
ncbi:MAG: glycosyltransferase [Methylobacteriaceae bacterium]|nr:glycosyltransferase [Methylobacteriaceae bacterium]